MTIETIKSTEDLFDGQEEIARKYPAVEKIKQSIVWMAVKVPSEGDKQEYWIQGTGFFVAKGVIATAHHCLEGWERSKATELSLFSPFYRKFFDVPFSDIEVVYRGHEQGEDQNLEFEKIDNFDVAFLRLPKFFRPFYSIPTIEVRRDVVSSADKVVFGVGYPAIHFKGNYNFDSAMDKFSNPLVTPLKPTDRFERAPRYQGAMANDFVTGCVVHYGGYSGAPLVDQYGKWLGVWVSMESFDRFPEMDFMRIAAVGKRGIGGLVDHLRAKDQGKRGRIVIT